MELNEKASWIRHEEHLKVTTILRNSFEFSAREVLGLMVYWDDKWKTTE